MTGNQLGAETSPYLLQHKDNPVHWRPWGPAALAEAQAEDKPILLSIGYAACHWCHVMASESFENPAIAAVMNELFVPIKVDREERPDLDAIYQQALSLMGEQGGWPLTMFLTPAAKPFWGGTYFPPTQRWGRPGFPELLRGVAATYRAQPDKVAKNVEILTDGLRTLSQPRAGTALDTGLLDRIARHYARAIDLTNGGIGEAPKFPNCGVLEAIWRGWRRSGEPALRDAVLLSLDHMSQGGIYDHLGGGYARYSVDARWLVPHFEKMLYDNAQLIELLCQAWQETGKPLYRSRVEETIGWLRREMMAPDGGFAATLDADSEHEEGKFYVWDAAEIDRLLGADAPFFRAWYDVTDGGNWEGKTILNRLRRLEDGDAETEAMLARCRAVLFEAREPRIRPGRDDKVLADWNGLMIAALAEASRIFERPDWLAAAEGAFGFVVDRMTPGGRLLHSWRAGRSHPGTLDDHADMARAALRLHEATGNPAYLAQAEAWVATLDRHFADPDGGYFFSADDTESLIVRTKTAADGAVPAGNGVMVEVLWHLHLLTGRPDYARAAERQVETFAGEVERNFFPLAAWLNGIDTMLTGAQIVVVGRPAEVATEAMLAVLRRTALPGRLLQVVAPGTELPQDHPAASKSLAAAPGTTFVCRGRSCSLPITDPDALERELRRH